MIRKNKRAQNLRSEVWNFPAELRLRAISCRQQLKQLGSIRWVGALSLLFLVGQDLEGMSSQVKSESESILCESKSSGKLSLLGLDLKCTHATSIASANITSLEIIALAWLLSQELSSASWWWWWSALCLPSSSSELFSCPPCKSESLKGTWSIEKI